MELPENQVEVLLRGGPVSRGVDAFSLGGRKGNVVTSSRTPEVLKGWRLVAVDGQLICEDDDGCIAKRLLLVAQRKPHYTLRFGTGFTSCPRPRKAKSGKSKPLECTKQDSDLMHSIRAAVIAEVRSEALVGSHTAPHAGADAGAVAATVHERGEPDAELDQGIFSNIARDPSLLYKDVRFLGSGAFGSAFLVRHVQTDFHYVAKKCCVQSLNDRQKQGCLDEISLLRRVRNDYIAQYVDFLWDGEDRQIFWLILKYYPGGDVQQEIQAHRARDERLPPRKVRTWLTELCCALAHIHALRIVHCDVKGSNLFITGAENVVLGDFGVSKQLAQDANKADTRAGSISYMAPERFNGGIASFASDMWSAGVVSYEMASLRRPFEGPHLASLIYKIGSEDPSPLSSDICESELWTLTQQLLSKSPRERPSADEALRTPSLKTCVEALGVFHQEMEKIADALRTVQDHSQALGRACVAKEETEIGRTTSSSSANSSSPRALLPHHSWSGALLLQSCESVSDTV